MGKYEEAKVDLSVPVGQNLLEKISDEGQEQVKKGISYSGLKKKLNIKDKNYLQEAVGVNQRVNFTKAKLQMEIEAKKELAS